MFRLHQWDPANDTMGHPATFLILPIGGRLMASLQAAFLAGSLGEG